jgi:RNA polymerase sigma-70 factor (ECF subfamily)
MRAAQAGDASAYARLLAELTPTIRGFVRGRWTGSGDTEDVVQDVLLSIHAVRHTYDSARPLLPWVMAIARHRLVDVQRRHIRRAKNEVAVEVLPETFSDVGANRLTAEAADEIHRALATLPPSQRQAVELLRLKEMSLKEAAAASGKSVASLKVSMHRAMKSLKLVLTGSAEDAH